MTKKITKESLERSIRLIKEAKTKSIEAQRYAEAADFRAIEVLLCDILKDRQS